MAGTHTIARMWSRTSRALVAVVCGAAFMLSLSAESHAGSPDWVLDAIKGATDDPGELRYLHAAHRDCPIDAADVERTIRQVLIANEIFPRDLTLSRALFEQLVLDVTVSCLERVGGSFVYVVDAYFALHSPLDGKRLFIGRRFGRFGMGNISAILHALQVSVADAATTFLAANRGP